MVMFLFIVLLLLSAFLIMIVLLQRGRGGGLAGAFGSGGGSQSAFGTKTGDVFTTVTVVAFVLFMVLAIGLFTKVKWASIPDDAPAALGDKVSDTNISENSVKIQWVDKGSNIEKYYIYRGSVRDSKGNVLDMSKDPIAIVPVNQMEKTSDNKMVHYYLDTKLISGTDYYYQVVGINSAGTAPGPIIAVKTKGVAPPPASVPATTGAATTAATDVSVEATKPASATATAPATLPTATPGPTGPSLPAPPASTTAPSPTTRP